MSQGNRQFEVRSIRPGFAYQLGFYVHPSIVAEYGLETGRLKADFKQDPNASSALFTLDSDANAGDFTRVMLDDTSDKPGWLYLTLNISAENTALLTGSAVYFDVAHVQDGVPRIFSDTWKWPVKPAITRLS